MELPIISGTPHNVDTSRNEWAPGRRDPRCFGVEVRQQEGLGRLADANILDAELRRKVTMLLTKEFLEKAGTPGDLIGHERVKGVRTWRHVCVS